MNTIPPVSANLDPSWRQPSADRILIDDTHAMMDQATFDELQDSDDGLDACLGAVFDQILAGKTSAKMELTPGFNQSTICSGKMWKWEIETLGKEKQSWLLWFEGDDHPNISLNVIRRRLIVVV